MQSAFEFNTSASGGSAVALHPATALYRIGKRLMDVVLSAVLLLCLLPLLALVALLVVVDSPGPVLFRQQRVGERGRVFTFLKFRSMYPGADQSSHRSYMAKFINGQAEADSRDGDRLYKLVADPRVTRVGRWLRRTSLDELPQLWNVLVGQMSLVGPRPPIPYEVEHYRAEYLQRLAVKPGITGLWQVSGRIRTTFEEMLALDLEYIRRRSLLMDLTILLKTVPTVLLGKDAR